MDDHHFHQLLQHLGLSWPGYRKVRRGVKKRIHRHMQHLGCKNMSAYLCELGKSDETRHECERLMTVSISRFFRDRELWEVLDEEILPRLIEKQGDRIEAWSAGCGCGEEVYSLKMVWGRVRTSIHHSPELEITATDMNPIYLERAKAGVYGSSSLKEVSGRFVSTYFRAEAGEKLFAINDLQKKGIAWQIHNLLLDPPGSHFHLIFLRNNLLTYYQEDLEKTAFRKVIDCLSEGGFLIIGSHEKLPFESDDLRATGSLSYVFQKYA
jgi:chemotaxis protein methyltransferase CheR